MTSFESKTVRIAHAVEKVYALLSDLSNLDRFQSVLNAPENRSKLKITGYDCDSLSIEVSPIGSDTFPIVKPEPNKTTKFKADNSPPPPKLWRQFVATRGKETGPRVPAPSEVTPSI